MKLTRIAVGGVAGMMGLGLIGVGAHAAFTTTTQSHQTITAGTLRMVLSSATASSGNNTNTLVLNAKATAGSTFTSGTALVTATNEGSLTAKNIKFTTSVSHGTGAATVALETEAYVCVAVTNGGPWVVIYNGPLAGAPHSQPIAGTEAPGGTAQYIINVYAGTVTTKCGANTAYGSPAAGGTSTAPSLTNPAEGGSITVAERVTYTA